MAESAPEIATAPEIALLQRLIQCPSITPNQAGAVDLLESLLADMGFSTTRLPFGDGSDRVDNLFALWGNEGKHLGFSGHIDVVPAGDESHWRHPPFAGVIEGEVIYGRGAVDMKGGIAAFIIAVHEWIKGREWLKASVTPEPAQISILITSDEEGKATHGTKPMVEWVKAQGLMADAFLVGEPTNPDRLGEAIKHGRRGSLSGVVTAYGTQGHVAYPHLADNPIPRLLAMLAPLAKVAPLTQGTIDKGSADFDPSTVAITSIDTGNSAANVTPHKATACFNIRYSTEHTARSLQDWFTQHCATIGGEHSIDWHHTAEPFITKPGEFTDLVQDCVEKTLGIRPHLSTAGGTSDARFIAAHAPVVEFGLVGRSMHQIDEATPLADVTKLKNTYRAILERFFSGDKSL